MGCFKMFTTCHAVLTVTTLSLLSCSAVVRGNMNGKVGQYQIANANTSSKNKFSTDYGDTEYFDVYSNVIKTRYSEVYWIMQDAIELPDEIRKRFADKTIAIVGYEVDQVQKTPTGDDIPLPITFAYNHHYCAWLYSSKKVEFVPRTAADAMDYQSMSHGHEQWETRLIKNESNEKEEANGAKQSIPHDHFFSEGNGGEFRLSHHGYPQGYAQLLQSPDSFRINPMHIDTWNRDEMNIETQIKYKPGPLPKSSQIPQSAGYNGLIECPCSDKLKKEWSMVYRLLSSSTNCGHDDDTIHNSTECFSGAKSIVQSSKFTEQSIKDKSKPQGCSVEQHSDGTTDITWNSESSSVSEEEALSRDTSTMAKVVAFAKVKDVAVTVTLETAESKEAVNIKISGPADKWFGIGFGSNTMCLHMEADECPDGGPYSIIVTKDDDNNRPVALERKLDFHGPGIVLDNSLTIKSHEMTNDGGNNRLSVTLTRTLKGMSDKHYTFNPSDASPLPVIIAQGCSTTFAQHCGHGPATLNFLAVDKAQSVCRYGIVGTIGGKQFSNKRCAAPPTSDLLAQNNPTCFIEKYRGGLSCCRHGQSLLDSSQGIPWPDQYLEFYLKFRFYFEEYKEGTVDYTNMNDSHKPSHENLLRLYWQTEAFAGEYDVVQCDPGVPSSQCVHTITSRFKVGDLVGKEKDDPNLEGIKLIYAGPHCHAPTCLSMELYNADTGSLLCRSVPIHGTSDNDVYNENGFIAIPPCLWGTEEEGLVEAKLLSWNTTLLSIKRNNNTLGHTGEMASWQMRGAVVPKNDMNQKFDVLTEKEYHNKQLFDDNQEAAASRMDVRRGQLRRSTGE